MPQELALRDIILPTEIGLWPPAIGWWALLIIIPASLYLCYWLYKRLTRQTVLKQAKKSLLTITSSSNNSERQTLQQLSIWLRRVAISVDGRQHCASLTGQDWLRYLDTSVAGKPFSEGQGRYLIDALYSPELAKDLDIPAISALCEQWLKGLKHD